MTNFSLIGAQDLKILIEYDSEKFKEDRSKCFRFQFWDKENQNMHDGNNLACIKDEDMAAIHEGLRSILCGVVVPEIQQRVHLAEIIQKEIDTLTDITKPTNPLKKLEAIMASKAIIPFKSQGPKTDSQDGKIVDHGELGNLKYEVYSRNVIHIFDSKLMFHKDIDAFEEEVAKQDFAGMQEGESIEVKGAGATDNLVFRCADGEIIVELSRRGFDMIEKLKSVLRKNSKK